MSVKIRWVLLAVLAVVGALVVVTRTEGTSLAGDERYQAQVRRTEYGIPHVSAKDFGGLGYGYGYAFAQDNLCVMASWVLTLRGERSRHFGAEAMSDDPIGEVDNLTSDVYYTGLRESNLVRRLLARPAPLGPTQQARELVDGYVAGYNRYLEQTGVDRLPDPTCRGKGWVGPITATDVWTNLLDFNRMAGTAEFKKEIVGEADDEPAGDGPVKNTAPGSNAWALGAKATRDGTGMLLADPHYPWNGIRRFYQVQLTIPGVLNVSGASLYGTPAVQIGHTAGVAWSHTVSHAQRFTVFQLKLAEGGYLVDGKVEPMGRQEVTVTVQGGKTVTKTLYTSRYGPVLALGRTKTSAFALADANASNLRSLNEWLAMGAAQNLTQLRAAQDTYQGLAFTYTLATDAGGSAYFADASVVPHVTDAHAARCKAEAELPEVYVLDGSRSDCGWGRDSDAIEPGIFGPGQTPKLTRDDYVANSNISPWMTNPKEPLTYPRIFGDTGTDRELRPRLSLAMIQDGRRFTLDSLQAAAVGKRNYSAELGRADVVAVCRATPEMTASDGSRVDVRQACDTLAAWDGRAELDSRGAILWREVFTALERPVRVPPAGKQPEETQSWWRVPFDPKHPLTTPRGLDRDNPALQRAMADVVQFFQTNRISLELTPGQAQHYGTVPVPGCTGGEGCFDRVRTGGPLGKDGRYPDVDTGSSFLMAVELTAQGPRARTILTYSLSANPASPHHADQTVLFSRGQWVTGRFTEAEIAADPHLQTTDLRG